MKKVFKNTILILLFLVLSVSTAFLAYLHFGASDDEDLSGQWIAELDVTEQVAVAALGWLQDIEGVSVSMEDMESYMQNMTIQVNLVFEQTARSEGTFRCNIPEESYEACNQVAYEAFAMVFQELLAERLRMAGYAGSTDQEAVEALVTETFGMSTVSYLMSCGPALLPSLEELQDQYDGSGTYETAEGILIRRFDDGRAADIRTECYIREDANLILFEEADSVSGELFSDYYPMIYTLRQTQNQ